MQQILNMFWIMKPRIPVSCAVLTIYSCHHKMSVRVFLSPCTSSGQHARQLLTRHKKAETLVVGIQEWCFPAVFGKGVCLGHIMPQKANAF